MDLKVIKNLLNLIAQSDVNEVDIEEGDFKIRIKKRPDVIKSESQPVYYSEPQAASPPPAAPNPPARPAAATEPQAETSASAEEDSRLVTQRSPIVGTFYSASSPDADPYVKVGDTVKKGDTLCIIEAMKIMNEIESDTDGKIVKILAENAQPVEFNQPLYLIEPV